MNKKRAGGKAVLRSAAKGALKGALLGAALWAVYRARRGERAPGKKP